MADKTSPDQFSLEAVPDTIVEGVKAAAPTGLDPSAPPQQFLGQALGAATGYSAPTDNDSITPAVSPLDFLPYEKVVSAGADAALAAGRVLAPGAKALLADEAGVLRLPSQGMIPAAKSELGVATQTQPGFTSGLSEAKSLLDQVHAGVEAGTISPDKLVAATQRYGQELDKAQKLTQPGRRPRRMAEGGEVGSPLDSAFEGAFDDAAAPSPDNSFKTTFESPAAQPTIPQPTREPVANTSASLIHVLNPDGNLVSIPADQYQEALKVGYQAATPERVASYKHEEKYGTTEQMLKAGAEGLAQGIAGPLAPAFEKHVLGVSPEAMRGREEVNPGIHAASEAAGLVGGALTGAGEGALLEKAGMGLRGLLPAGKGTFISQLGPEAVKSAFETALYQGGEELSKAFKENPEQTADTAIADIGLAGVMGGVFGGPIGALLNKSKLNGEAANALQPNPGKFVSELDRPAMEAGDLATSIQHADNIPDAQKEKIQAGLLEFKDKANAPEIRSAAKRLGAPVLEGMVSDNKWVQKAEDSLVNGAPTYSGIRRAKLYEQAHDIANNAVDQALGDPSRYSKAELGDIMKNSITGQFKDSSAPIEALYNDLKASHEVIPLATEAAPQIAKDIKELTELRLSPSSPEGQLANRVVKEIENLKTVDDVKNYKSILRRSVSPTAPSGEKRMVAILSDKLANLEESSIEQFAKTQAKQSPEAYERIMGLIDQRKEANKQYAGLMSKVGELAEQLGKKRVYGIQDAIHFINDLTPETVTQKLFSKNNSGFLKFFSKEFPEQNALMQEYQKGALRAEASKTGDLSPKLLFNKINKLEPEIQKSIFTKEELQKLKDAEVYLRSFPENFNPSGTSGMSAFREFFSNPVHAATSNARDLLLEKFVSGVGSSPQTRQAVQLGAATVSGANKMNRAVSSLFGKGSFPVGIMPAISHREALKRVVDRYAANPQDLLTIGDSNPVPDYAKSFASTSARASQYLNSLKPVESQNNPLDTKHKPTKEQEYAYNRALDIAQSPLVVLDRMSKGTLTPQDITTIKVVYPGLYSSLSQKLLSGAIDTASKGKAIPYATRLQLSMFLGRPMDSTMTPQSILNAQVKQKNQPQPGPSASPSAPHGNTSKLKGIPQNAQTAEQARAARELKH